MKKISYPKISIVTPSYNQAGFLEATIKSVLGQQYPNLEYIIIDGGSSDGSIEIIKKYEKELHYWVSEPDGGIYNALNKGFAKSSGEIMGWINSDDMYHPNSFYSLAEIFSKFEKVQWVEGATTFYDEYSRTIAASSPPGRSFVDFLLGNYRWIQQESTFWRKELWFKSGGKLDESYKYAADFDLWVRFFQNEALYSTNALIGGFRIRSSNQLSLDNKDTYEREAEKIVRSIPVNSEVREKVEEIRKYRRLSQGLIRSKFFNLQPLQSRLLKREFLLLGYKPKIGFDRGTQSFVLKDW